MNKLISLNEKIFIAGGSGMVGSAIKRKLLESGYGNQTIGGIIYSPPHQELDLLNSNAVENWFKKNTPTIVILAAAKVGGIKANNDYSADFLLENLKIQTNVIESSFESGVKRFMFLGSSCIYPRKAIQPIKEEYLLDGYLERTNEAYAIAKIAGLKLCEHLNIQYGFDAISLMPTNLYGPGDNYHPENSHVMAAMIRKFAEAKKYSYKTVTCWGTGNVLREFLHVDDLANAAVFALENWDPKATNSPKDKDGNKLLHLNVGTGEDLSIKELSIKIASLIGYNGSIFWDKTKPDGTPKKQLDISRIRSLGWEPKKKLNEGILEIIQKYYTNLK